MFDWVLDAPLRQFIQRSSYNLSSTIGGFFDLLKLVDISLPFEKDDPFETMNDRPFTVKSQNYLKSDAKPINQF